MKSISKRLVTVIIATAVVLSTVFVSVPVYADTNNNRTVKVGFFAYPGYHEINDDVRSGYGYDFLSLLQRYTDLNYDYVGYENSWEDMLKMLLDGEIDLVTSARKTLEREELYDFSEPIGTNSAQISVRQDDERFIPGNYSALNGKVIGELTGNSRNADMAAFAEEKGFTFNIKEYNTAEELEEALQSKKVDAIATSSLRKTVNEKTVAEFAPQDFYVIVKKGNTELLEEINYGIGQMDINEENWRDDLFYKNYKSNNNSYVAFSQREQDYIKAVQNGEKTITVTAQPDREPYSFAQNGKLTGIIPDYFAHLMETAGLPYTTVVAKDNEEFLEWMKNNHTDVVMDCRLDSAPSSEFDFGIVTNPYMTLTTSCVTKKGFSGTIHSVATLNRDTERYEDNIAEDAVYIPVASRKEAMDAVKKGKADACFVYTLMAEKYINTDSDSNLQSVILREPVYDERIYISPNADHELSSILNKCIKADNSGVLDEYIKKYTSITYENFNLIPYLRAHLWIIVLTAVILVVLIALLIWNYFRARTEKSRNEQLERELFQQQKLEESLTFTNYFLGTYISAYYADLNNLSYQIYKGTDKMNEDYPKMDSYIESLSEYIKRDVHPDDQDALLSLVQPGKMRELLSEHEEYVHIFRDISEANERMFKLQVIRGADEDHAAFGFSDVTEEMHEQQRHFLGAIPLSNDVLGKANIGLWAFELDEGKAPRMYVDDTMLGLIGLKHQVSPEETYHAWYDYIDDGAYDLVAEAVEKMSAGIHAEVQYPWHHPDGKTTIVRCGGVRNPEYIYGIRIEGTHQDVTETLHYDEEEQRKKRDNLGLMLMSALSEAYASLYYITPETGEYQLITRDNEFGNKVNTRLAHGGNFYDDSYVSISRVIYEEDKEKMSVFSGMESMEKAFNGQDSFTLDYRLVIEGVPIWYRVKTVKILSDDNEMKYALGIMSIQEELKRQETLQKNLEIIEILASEYSSVYYIDLTTDELDTYTMNEETESEFGHIFRSGIHYSDAFKMYVDTLVYSQDKEMMLQAGSAGNILNELSDKKTFVTTYRSDNNGNPHYCEMKFVKVGEDKNPRAVALGFADKNDEIRKEMKRKEIAARDAAVIAGLSDDFGCVVYVDYRTGEEIHYRFDPLLSANIPNWEQIHNFDQRIATLTETLMYSEDREFFDNAVEGKKIILGTIDKEGVYYRNFRVVINGELVYYQLKIIKDENSDNHVIAGLRNIDDTAKRELEYQEKLELANKSKSDFLFNMSHDIRTPMNAIIGFTQLAKKHIDDRDRTIDSLNKIESSGNHLLELINEVLDMSRVEAGKLHSDMKEVNISDEAIRLVTICRESAFERNINISYQDINIVHQNVLADQLHINQIMMNILGNSVKYTQPGGKVFLTAKEEESNVPGYGKYVFTVEDTGIGMSPEFLKHIFESFAREDKASTSKVQGTGLGMAIVKRLVDYMDGTIDIESEQGKGTKVMVTLHLQLVEGKDNAANPDETVEVDLIGKKVLLVEDNDLNREIATDILEEQGMIIDEAVNGIDAIEHVTKHGAEYYDFILMDIQMPMMDGYETTSRIRKLPNAEKLPIIALSANAFEEDKKKSIEAGMNDHVSKPIVIPDLIAALARFKR